METDKMKESAFDHVIFSTGVLKQTKLTQQQSFKNNACMIPLTSYKLFVLEASDIRNQTGPGGQRFFISPLHRLMDGEVTYTHIHPDWQIIHKAPATSPLGCPVQVQQLFSCPS